MPLESAFTTFNESATKFVQVLVRVATFFLMGMLLSPRQSGGTQCVSIRPRDEWFGQITKGLVTVFICYKNRETGVWQDVEFSPENIELAVIELSSQVESFLEDLLADKLQGKLDELD